MIHEQFRAAIIAAARKVKPGVSNADLEAIVAKVAASPAFAYCADILNDDLRRLTFAETEFESVVRVFANTPAAITAAKPLAADAETWRKLNPSEKLARHYEAEAGERPDIESAARAERVGADTATPLDKLTHHRASEAPPTKQERRAADNPAVKTSDLAEITDPSKRLHAYRGRVADTRSVERLKLDHAAYSKKALDPNTPPSIRVAANLELSRINERLKALNAA